MFLIERITVNSLRTVNVYELYSQHVKEANFHDMKKYEGVHNRIDKKVTRK